jgi:hypothetical protein
LKLNNVQAAHTELALADEGLVLANAFGELDLAHADTCAGSSKLFQEERVLGGMKRFGHQLPVRAVDSFDAMFDYAKIALK